jgi:quercetin dioxygenase-like cupin family protein
MAENRQVWVLGHRVRLLETDPAYGMIECVSSPGVPGPPPHHHRDESEFFHVLSGRLDCMVEGEWRRCEEGTFVEVPPGATHTFINNSDADVVWVTGWRPRGFERFFRDFGVPVTEPDAQSRSVEEALIQRVIETAESYGMVLDLSEEGPGG